MIELTQGDILASGAEALVNTVNCVGVMGRGIAAQFKRAFPANFKAYAAACRRGEVAPGRMFVFDTGSLTGPRYVINFPTKDHWRAKSRMSDIDSGLEALVDEIRRRNIRSVAIPPLGCGLGGLSWSDVRPRVEGAFAALPDVQAIVFEPAGAPPAAEMARTTEPAAMTPGRAVLIRLMQRYLDGLMDTSVSLLEVHKLLYFAQESGQPLRLQYAKSHYGPYAENLRHVLSAVEGHLLSGYADGGDMPDKPLEVLPGANERANAKLANDANTLARFERVAELVDGFESPFGLELLATVHWVATREGARDPDAAVAATHAWSDRKRQFSPEQIRLALDVLAAQQWIAPEQRP